jgi:hypothetical protein
MHWTLLVTLDRCHAQSSRQARRFAAAMLGTDPTFVATDGIGAVCDGFVVGGRASGLLAWAKAHMRRVGEDRLVPGLQVSAVLPRDPHRLLGVADDAQLVDQALYRSCLQNFAGQRQAEIEGTLVYRDLDGDSVNPTFIAAKWLIVLDCHG